MPHDRGVYFAAIVVRMESELSQILFISEALLVRIIAYIKSSSELASFKPFVLDSNPYSPDSAKSADFIAKSCGNVQIYEM